MSHSVQENHKFIVVNKDQVHSHYSAQHLGRVKSWIKNQSQENKDCFDYEILEREVFYSKRREEVEVEFFSPHEPNKLRTTTLSRGDLGSSVDPSTERYWQM